MGNRLSCTFRFELIRFQDEEEVLLTGIPDSRDDLSLAVVEGRVRYDIENTLAAADWASQRACENLRAYLPPESVYLVRRSLRELIINAIEHGNLEITWQEKFKALRGGRYLELVQQKRSLSEFKDRRVSLEYSVTPQRVVFRLADQGKGFDYDKHLNNSRNSEMKPVSEVMGPGQGIFMALRVFDRLEYNDRGNQVIVEKAFH
jgi:hypothetical protein